MADIQLQPLRQSMVETAACPRAFVEIYLKGKQQPDSLPSERGQDIHRVLSEYVSHCAAYRIPADWIKFDQLAKASGPDAGPILDGLRDSYEVDWAHVYGTEITLALDEEFEPTFVLEYSDSPAGTITHGGRFVISVENQLPGVHYSENPAAYTGTLDCIILHEDGVSAEIPDYKSHPAVFEADTFQGTLYPFMLFKHMPALQTITFKLVFVRYRNCFRTVTWTREEMPAMQAIIARARTRQQITTENPDDALALPCKTCAYCPLARNMTCPIAEFNEYTTLSLVDRLRWKVWMTRMGTMNNKVLRDNAEVSGPIRYVDGNGNAYEYGEQEVASTRYPLDDTLIGILNGYTEATGDDWRTWHLNVSSTALKSKLKAKKREGLRADIEGSCVETGTKPKYAVRTPEGIETGYNPNEQD